MANNGLVKLDGVWYPAGIHGTPLTGKTNEKMFAKIMQKSFDGAAFHRESRRVHGTSDDYRKASGDNRA